MRLRDVLNATDHAIVDGWEHQWRCYPDGRGIECASEFARVTAIYSTHGGQVYEVNIEFTDPPMRNHQPYRWVDPEFRASLASEAKKYDVDNAIAWDSVKWIDLETEEDCLTKLELIFAGKEFDERISIPLDLPDEVVLKLALAAHEQDITMNEYICRAMRDYIDRINAGDSKE